MRIVSLVGLLAAALLAPVHAGSLTVLGVPGGQATWISPDGRTVIGSYPNNGGGWLWQAASGAVQLEGARSAASAAGDSFPVVGDAVDASTQLQQPALWSAAGGEPRLLGGLPGAPGLGGMLATSYAVSDDGTTVVGLAYGSGSGNGNAHAFVWNELTGMSALAKLTPERAARANGVSADGRVIWGWNDTATGFRRGVRWDRGVISELLDTAGGLVGEVARGNRDGSILVGSRTSIAGKQRDIWRWTATTGAVPLGHIAFGGPTASSFAFDVSEDGGVIVGASGFGINRTPTVWTAAQGLRPLADLLVEQGVTIPAGLVLNSATGVSADGLVIAGWGTLDGGFESFLIDLRPAVFASGFE